jgi:5-methylcytosine-specific restriction endonuclease McrA
MITEEQRHNIFSRDQFLCKKCGKHIVTYGTPQLAHRVRKGKQAENHIMAFIWNEYQKDRGRQWVREFILSNELNLVSTCSTNCNSYFNIFTMSVERDNLIREIIEATKCLKYERMQ